MSAEAFRGLVEAITARPVAIVPRCSGCDRPCHVAMASPDGAVRYCADCLDFGIAARMKAARDEARRK